MTSPLLALFARSLREDTRAKSTYWARAGLAAFFLLILLTIAAVNRSQGAPGLIFFSAIISLQMVCITLVGLIFFASAIAEEKEEETLGLLRMTNLNPLSILLGKSTSRLCGALLLLVALLPFTLLAITLGGVSLAQILACYCTLGAYTFFLCNLALFWSVIAATTARAVLFTVFTLTLFFTGGWLLEIFQSVLRDHGWMSVESAAGKLLIAFTDDLAAASPITRLWEILRTSFSGAPAGWQVWSNIALGFACFLAAWAAFTRCADRAADGATEASPRRRFLGIRFRRPPRPWKDALAWKDFHFLSGGTPGFVVRLLFYGGLVVCMMIASAQATPGQAMWHTLANSLAGFAFLLELAVLASRVFRTELSAQTWSSLALLPLTVRQIARRKLLGGLLATVPAAVTMLLATALSLIFIPSNTMGMSSGMVITSTAAGWISTLFIIHLIAFLSLLLKRGALALGFVIAYASLTIIQILSMAVIFGLGGFGGSSVANLTSRMMIGPILSSVVYLIAIFVLYRAILVRLETAAAEA